MVEQALEASSSFPLLQSREHVRLDGPHFAAAWRLSFAIHVFGRQSRLARAEQPDKAPAKYAFRLFRRKKQQARGRKFNLCVRAISLCCSVYDLVKIKKALGRLKWADLTNPSRYLRACKLLSAETQSLYLNEIWFKVCTAMKNASPEKKMPRPQSEHFSASSECVHTARFQQLLDVLA